MTEPDAPDLSWRKSSTSDDSNCVQVAATPVSVFVRHSRDRSGRVLSFSYAEWDAFLEGVRNNEFGVDVLASSPED